MTLCEECEHSHEENKKRPVYRWMCMRFPRMELDNFVSTDVRISDPYMYCSGINGGKCPMFQKVKGKQKELL